MVHLPGAEDDDRIPRQPLQWLLLMIGAALAGALTGFVGACFRIVLAWADDTRTASILWAHAHVFAPVGWLIPTVLCAAGAGLGCWLAMRFSPETAGSGIPRVEAVLRTHMRPAESHILPVKFFGGALTIGSGLALGREGPTVQMGGTIGRILADWFGWLSTERATLIAASAGAGLAVAFNAPLAAVIFVVEELIHRFSARVLSATLVACITGSVVLRLMLGNRPDFGPPYPAFTPVDVLPAYLVLGAAAGLLGVIFNISLLATLRLFDRAANWPKGFKGAAVGAAVGLLAWFMPDRVGGGENVAQFAITSHPFLHVAAGLLIMRFFLTMASYGCGAPGGIFAPLLAIGALLGSSAAAFNAHLRHVPSDPAAFAIVAMAACFTSIVRSPLTGVVLLLEMTGSWTLILPMMAASVTAYAIPELLGNPPIYDSLRERDERVEKAKA